MATLQEITSEPEFTSALSSTSPTTLLVLYFHTPWAAPCKQMHTILTTLAAGYPSSSSSTRWLSINAEDLADISEQYDVTAVPFVVLLKGGKVVESVSGSEASKVRDAVERHAPGRSGQSATTATPASIPPPQEADPRNGPPPSATGSVAAEGVTDGAAGSKEELHARLTSLVKAAPVMLFMKGTPSGPQCGFSRQLVGLLRDKSVRYGFFNILADEDVRQGLKEFADWPTFPQLWVNGELVGGLDIVKEELANDPEFFKDFASAATAA